jgi:hypothetical protein
MQKTSAVVSYMKIIKFHRFAVSLLVLGRSLNHLFSDENPNWILVKPLKSLPRKGRLKSWHSRIPETSK